MKKIHSYRQTDKKRWGISGDISIKDIEELLIKQNNKCYVCKELVLLDSWTNNCLYQFSVDRINENLPHDRDNFLISCFHCNCTLYVREGSKEKMCINGCHTEKKIFKSTRIDELSNMEYLRLSRNPNRDIELKNAFELYYNNKKIRFEEFIKNYNETKLEFFLEKRIILQRLFMMYRDGIKVLYTPTEGFMNELYELRKNIYESMKMYTFSIKSIFRPFDEWYINIQSSKTHDNKCSIIIRPDIILQFDENYEERFNSKIKKRIQKEFKNIYKRKEFELNPIRLMKELNEYFLLSHYPELTI